MGCQYFAPCAHGAESFTVMMPKLTFGRGCLGEIGDRVLADGHKRVAVFTDPFLKDGPYLTQVVTSLEQSCIDVSVFSEVYIEPNETSVLNAAHFLRSDTYDAMISVGGGSVIDTAKAAAVYAAYPTDFTDYFGPPVGIGKAIPGPVLPHYACPTTSGTGSECTSVSVLRIDSLNAKFVIGSPYLLPKVALVDPACTDTLPANTVASTGFDLVCHALECYTAKAYTQWERVENPNQRTLLQGANPWSDMSAQKAMEIAGNYLSRGVNDATDKEARDQLMWGATLAGMAFGNSGTHLPHAMSYGVTHLMSDIVTEGYPVKSPFIPHGISVILSAPTIFQYLAEGAPERHLEAAAFLGADCNDATPIESGELVSKRLIEMMQQTQMPNGLSGVGFDAEDIKPLAASSIRQTRAIANAPRESNLVDMENIYSNSISYW